MTAESISSDQPGEIKLASFAELVTSLMDAGKALAQARYDEAEAFLRFRITAKSDNQAKAQAVIETGAKLDFAIRNYDSAKACVEYAIAERGHK